MLDSNNKKPKKKRKKPVSDREMRDVLRKPKKSVKKLEKQAVKKAKKKAKAPVRYDSVRINKRALKKTIIAVAAILVIVCGLLYVKERYTVDTIVVEGSTHYSNDEITDMVLGDGVLSHNSIYLSAKYNDKEIKDVPFVETMNVRIMSPNSIKISVYEKAIAGFVEQMGRYIYFDKDGTVIESSDIKTAGIPQIIGMKLDHFVLNEKLPVEDEKIFKKILEVSQLLDKYDISVDKIFFDDDYNLTLYFDEARVKLGSFDNIDEKIIRLKTILPQLEGKKGVLRMENYTADTSITTFEFDE